MNRVDQIIPLIVAVGQEIAIQFQHQDCCKFRNGIRWISYCGMIPAFAYVIIHETIYKTGNVRPTPEQMIFFRSIEVELFNIYDRDRLELSSGVPLCRCLLLQEELSAACQHFQVDSDCLVTPDMILGIIFPNRMANYQIDLRESFMGVARGEMLLPLTIWQCALPLILSA